MVCDKALLLPSNTTALAINADRVTYGSVATYSCLPGYAIRDVNDTTMTRTCQANGTWNSTASHCEC